MNSETSKILSKILNRREIDKIPTDTVKKIEKYFDERFEEFISSQAVHESSQRSISKKTNEYEKLVHELQTKNQDYDVKLDSSQKNVTELRAQLDTVRADVSRYQQTIAKHETELIDSRRQRDNLISERDALQSTLESRYSEIERLKCDVKELNNQLGAAINAKYDAIAKYDEIQAREASLEYKERRMDQDRNILQSQLQSLTESYNSNIEELLALRKEKHLNRLDLETKLTEKTEELNIANDTIAHLKETNQALMNQLEEISAKRKEDADDAAKMVECYKNEIMAKAALADMYKLDNDNHNEHVGKLNDAIAELRKMLHESVESYGELETEKKAGGLQFTQDLEEKESIIKELRDELKNANDLLKAAKDEQLEMAMERVAPSAAAASKLIKSNMTLTEIYSLYVKTAENLRTQERENSNLKIQLQEIVKEIELRAPEINQRDLECEKLRDANAQIREQLDNLIGERSVEHEQFEETKSKLSYAKRELKTLISTKADLSRQVCYLLKVIEESRGGLVDRSDQSVHSDMSAADVITKKLVTFADTNELQENNEKLLLLVRDLSSKLEELEVMQSSIDQASYESKITNYARRLESMESQQLHQTHLMNTYIQQRDRYKMLYHEIMKDVKKPMGMDGGENMEGVDEETPLESTSSVSSAGAPANNAAGAAQNNKRVAELEEKLKDLQKALENAKKEYEEYRKDKMANDKLLDEHFNQMRTEVRSLTSLNCKLKNQNEFMGEQIKTQEKNVASLKKQITTLEERNRVYDLTISKHEQTITHMREDLISTKKQYSNVEMRATNLQRECEILRTAESRLQMERESLHRERQTQNIVLNNLEMIKCQFERSENEGKLRLEQRLDETSRECSALRRHLQEEQDRFRELSADLERQTKTAQQMALGEKSSAEQLRTELQEIRAEITDKTTQIESLSAKLQEALTPNKADNPIAKANKRAKELQLKLDLSTSEIEHLKKDLEANAETIERYSAMANAAEIQLKDLGDRYQEYKSKTDEELQKTKASESDLQSRVAELETEIKLQVTDAQLATTDSVGQLYQTQQELKEALQKISENNTALRDLREQSNILTAELKGANDKYTKAMQMHTSDLHEFNACKEKLSNIQGRIEQLTVERDQAIGDLDEVKKGHDATREMMLKEKDELEKRFVDLDSQNTALHDQLQALSTTMSIRNDTSLNESQNAENSIVNRSVSDDDNREQLLQVIKYLRKEKNLANAKVDVVQSEKVRLTKEVEILREKLREASDQATSSAASASNENPATTLKYEDVMNKLNTFNALTDSNRMLRDERESLTTRLREVTERNTQVENELFPLQEKIRDQSAKMDELQGDNAKLRNEAMQWRQRANNLVERSNKNPEDFKRLQTERENLAKMLTVEKEKNDKVEGDLTALRQEKTTLDTELAALNQQIQSLTDEKNKLAEEVNEAKQATARTTNEIIEMKNTILVRDDEVKKLVNDLNTKEASLVDVRNKEVQIRKIAKKYKDSYFELLKADEQRKAELASLPLEQQAAQLAEAGPSRAQAEEAFNARIRELEESTRAASEQNEALCSENEALSQRIKEQEDAHAGLLRDLQASVQTLTEEKGKFSLELAVTKTQLLNCEQSRGEAEGLKIQNDSRISRLEKELTEAESQKELISRLSRDNESLSARIAQLNRQLGMQQGSKPATSSSSMEKSPSDPARTANVKPMAGPSSQQSVTPRRGGDTPLASIRPMSVQNSRTAAVLPTSQTPSLSSVHGSSSSSTSSSTSSSAAASSASCTASVTALVPPQQVHTTGTTAEAMSTTSSHDYMPATSSAALVVAAVPPMGSAGSSEIENAQEAESVVEDSSSSSSSNNQGIVQQQAVALVSPRQHEIAPQNITQPQAQQMSDQFQASTSASSSTSTSGQSIASTHNQASSTSNTVTTTQAGHKRPREADTDSTEDFTSDTSTSKKPQTKRTRVQIGSTSQGISESSCLEVEYQVPTSSQRDQDDDNIIVVDSDEEDDDMPDDEPVEPDDAPFDNVEQFDLGEIDYEAGNADIYDDENLQSDNNEVEVDDVMEVPNQSENQSLIGQSTASTSTTGPSEMPNSENSPRNQQSQTITSGSSEPGPSTSGSLLGSSWRPIGTPISTRLQQQQIILQESSDSIVPSTPTTSAVDGTDNAHGDIAHVEANASQPLILSPRREAAPTYSESANCSQAGPSNASMVSETMTIEDSDNNATTTETMDDKSAADDIEETEEEEEGTDGVSSEGEKTSGGNETLETEEEGREAEATEAPSLNTRSRGNRNANAAPFARRGRAGPRGSMSPQEAMGYPQQQHGGSPNRSFNQLAGPSPGRGQRNRRARRPQFRYN